VAPPPGPNHRLDPLGFVVAIVLVGVIFAAVHHAQTGMYIVCAGLGLGSVARLVLSPRNAGSLVVRGRRVDVVVMAGLCIAIGVLAAVTPFPAGQG
jgi:succinate dehydrogenase/fumarate reductase cytochrome b subunit